MGRAIGQPGAGMKRPRTDNWTAQGKRRDYVPPRLTRIELISDEVLSDNCKIATAPGANLADCGDHIGGTLCILAGS